MKVLVIGGTRFIGHQLCAHLSTRDHSLAVFHRGQAGAPHASVSLSILGDRKDLPEFLPAFQSFGPDAVVDMICSNVEEAERARPVYAALGVPTVVLSSMDVYRARDILWKVEPPPTQPIPLTEQAELRRTLYPYRFRAASPDDWAYRYDKIPAERAFLEVGTADALSVTILRLPAVYGPRDYQKRVAGYLRRMDHGRPAVVLEEAEAAWRMSRLSVGNVARAVTAIVEAGGTHAGVYNAPPDCDLSERAWIEAISTAAGWAGHVVPCDGDQLPDGSKKGFFWAQEWTVAGAKFEQTFGPSRYVDYRSEIEQTVAFDRTAGISPPDEPERDLYRHEDELLGKRTRP